jgi:hypothetical protein
MHYQDRRVWVKTLTSEVSWFVYSEDGMLLHPGSRSAICAGDQHQLALDETKTGTGP